jgi:DNA adenine methylase
MAETTFGRRLKQLREAAGLTQPALAEAAGVPVTSLRNWEQDHREPMASAVLGLARALGVGAGRLLGSEATEEPAEEPAPSDDGTEGGRLAPPLKTHGGKRYLKRRILELMPPHLHYVEAFAGGLQVLLARDPDDPRFWAGEKSFEQGVNEVVNDLNGDLINFWRTLQNDDLFGRLRRRLEATPCAEDEWRRARSLLDSALGDPVERASAFFICSRMSMAARMDCFTPIASTRTRRRMNELPSAWLTAIEGLPSVHTRLKRVVILNRPAVEVICSQDGPQTLFYLDPPYVHKARASTGEYGAFEMSEADHVELLELLCAVKGKVMLSGYESGLYDGALKDWNRHTKDLKNHAAGGKTKRTMTEVIWCNF